MKKQAMKPLDIRFTLESKEEISNTAEKLDLFDSYIARAALNIGLKEINKQLDQKCESKIFYDWIEDNQTA